MSQSSPSSKPHAEVAAANIRALNDINKSIPVLLSSSGQAIASLTLGSSASPSSAKADFMTYTTTFFTTVSSVSTSLHAQVRALETQGIIPPSSAADDGNMTTNGKLGNLDVSWLNSRVADKVCVGKEGEVWAEIRTELEKVATEKGLDVKSGEEKMELD
ncbi:hypothetical protein M501DRAFT_1004275 [Patellaria atrata CBS 101060]|uniref:Mediator of RNA polymerase II transcription subunit 11 n=1 Tax=Patellaria atrata CBS 101060 TaxID=1346257 RepID=A0A9P4VQN6_9PEZI|nr:hypothetical protein M501DRAFT_1004275 [Patellaria atrata CBS 101060]